MKLDVNKWWRSLRYEFRSRRTTSMALLHLMAVVVPLLYMSTASINFPLTTWRFAELFTHGLVWTGGILVAMLCAVSVGSEFRFGTAGQTVNWMGSRSCFAMSNLVVNSVSAIAVGLIVLTISWVLVVTVYGFSDLHVSVFGTDVARLAGLSLLIIWLWSLVGSGLALLLRSQVLSVSIVLGLFGMGEPFFIDWLGPERSRWLPTSASVTGLTWTHPDDPFKLTGGIEPAENVMYAVGPLALIAAFVLIPAWATFMRRDI